MNIAIAEVIFCLSIYTSQKVLHNLYYIQMFSKFLQTSRKITEVYW